MSPLPKLITLSEKIILTVEVSPLFNSVSLIVNVVTVGTVSSINNVELLVVPVVAFPDVSVIIAVKLIVLVSENCPNDSNVELLIVIVLFVSILLILDALPKLEKEPLAFLHCICTVPPFNVLSFAIGTITLIPVFVEL